jgi:hypothetical protein
MNYDFPTKHLAAHSTHTFDFEATNLGVKASCCCCHVLNASTTRIVVSMRTQLSFSINFCSFRISAGGGSNPGIELFVDFCGEKEMV